MRRQAVVHSLAGALALTWALAFGVVTPALAQTTTGTVRGFVRDAEGNPIPSANVVAIQPATNFQRGALSTATGFYNIPGLTPGVYTVRASSIGFADVERSVRVLIGQVVSIDFTLTVQAIAIEGLEVTVGQAVVETRTPEIATNITPDQIEAMPLNDRNILSVAALAPGVQFGCQGGNCAGPDAGGISGGGSSADNANIFVDGVSFKNEILRGGVAGQDASKGNPFPQVAVQEFRIISQQYKAEYPKAVGPVIVATTKSGTNRWEFDAFGFHQNKDLINQGFFAIRTCENRQAMNPPVACDPQPKQDRLQLGGSIGGPIIRDKLFLFASYEGNHQDRAFTVSANQGNLAQWPTAIQQEILAAQGTFPSEFRSDLFFGKLTYTPSSAHRFELSGNIRDEFDVRNFGGTQSLENAEDFNNDVQTVLAKHQYTSGNLLNEAQVSYQYYHWFPVQLNVDLIGRDYQGTMKLGGRCCPQDRDQKKLVFRNDVSYTLAGWGGDHAFKVGGLIDFSNYFAWNPLQINPQFTFVPANPTVPSQVVVGVGESGVEANNTQLGLYFQDDWSPTRRLILNLGVRWDYESNGLNNDYVTPANVVSEVGPRTDLLIFNRENYITDGGDRPAYKGMIQPRFGFSYDLTGDNRTVLFGGAGIYYDRIAFGLVAVEQLGLIWRTYTIRFSPGGTTPGTVAWDEKYFQRSELEQLIASGTTAKPEVTLHENDTRPPRSNHFSLGVRQTWRNLLFSVNYSGMRTYNLFTKHFANRNPTTGRTFELPSFRNVIVSTDEGRAWYDAVLFKVEKPYTRAGKWGGVINYTMSWTDDYFTAGRDFAGLSFHTPEQFARRRSERDQRHSVSANVIVGLPFDVRMSGIVQLGSSRPHQVNYGGDACAVGNLDCIGNEFPLTSAAEAVQLAQQGQPACDQVSTNPVILQCGTDPYKGDPETDSFLGIGGWQFRNVDLRLEKEFVYRGNRLALVAEGFNIFNYDNFVSFEGRIANLTPTGGITNVNPNFGNRTGAITDTRLSGAPRRWQFGLRLSTGR